MNFSEVNVRQVLRGLRFHEAIAKGGILKISDLETGFRVYEAEVPNGVFQGPEAVLMRLVENLVFIQDKVHLPLRMPGPRFTREDFEGVAMLVQKLKTGEIPLSDIGVDLDKESAIRMIEIFRDGSPLQADDAEEIVEICGATIPLGSMRVSCERACIPQADLDQLNATVASAQTGEMIHIRLTACEGYSMVAKYEKWLREN